MPLYSLFSSTLLEKSWNRDSNASGRIVDRRWIKAEEVPAEGEIHNFVVKRSASKGQDEGNHFLKGKLPVPGIVFAGSCGEEPFVVCHSLNCIFQCFFYGFWTHKVSLLVVWRVGTRF